MPNTIAQSELPEIAAKRGVQTLVQGLAVVIGGAVLAVVASTISGAESWDAWLTSWQTWTWLAFQAGATAGVAWWMRRYADTAGVET